MTENMKDGSDAIADAAARRDAAHRLDGRPGGDPLGRRGYAGYMTSAGVTLVADGTEAGDARLSHALTNDTSLGVMRYADAGYDEAVDEAANKGIGWFDLRES